MLLFGPDDLVFPAGKVAATATLLGAEGTADTSHAVAGNRGHLDGVINPRRVEAELRAFLQ